MEHKFYSFNAIFSIRSENQIMKAIYDGEKDNRCVQILFIEFIYYILFIITFIFIILYIIYYIY